LMQPSNGGWQPDRCARLADLMAAITVALEGGPWLGAPTQHDPTLATAAAKATEAAGAIETAEAMAGAPIERAGRGWGTVRGPSLPFCYFRRRPAQCPQLATLGLHLLVVCR